MADSMLGGDVSSTYSLLVPRVGESVDTDQVENMRKQNQKIQSENVTDMNHRWKKFVQGLGRFVNSKPVIVWMMFLTVYSLFSNDMRIAYTHSSESDSAFEIISSITFLFFIAEVAAMSLSRFQDYFMWPTTWKRLPNESLWSSIVRRCSIGSFDFWLDALATMTLLFEMPWLLGVQGPQTGENAGSGAARVAARAGRIVRLMRMARRIKLERYISAAQRFPGIILDWTHEVFTKCNDRRMLKQRKPRGNDKRRERLEKDLRSNSSPNKVRSNKPTVAHDSPTKNAPGNAAFPGAGEEDGNATADGQHAMVAMPVVAKVEEEDDDDTLVGATMSDLTNRRVIMVVVAMLVFVPILSMNDPDLSASVMVSLIHSAAYSTYSQSAPTSAMVTSVKKLINQQTASFTESKYNDETTRIPISFVTFNPPIKYKDANNNDAVLQEWRNESYSLSYYVRTASEEVTYERVTGAFTTKICFDSQFLEHKSAQQSMATTLFVVFLLVFGTYFFTREIDRLVIAPIGTMVSLVKQISENPLGVDYDKELGEKDGFLKGMETTILLNTINKIGSLMRVGFGEAGASIIASNLKNSSGGRLNLMNGGRHIMSIFGFCDVRQFTDTTECLQEEVMLFVNRIGHILHSIVVQCSGSANKNIGDAFLLTWKYETSDDGSDGHKERTAAEEQAAKQNQELLADQALLTFCRALIELSTYQDFICNFSAAANERLYKRFPGYLVRIGSGLHRGWAIEGAVGSNRKIDATYLSPHVNFTEFLESSTKAYGTPLLISDEFFKMLSPAAAKYVRCVDCIKKPDLEQPMKLYTYDSDLSINWADLRRRVTKKTKRASTFNEPGQNRGKAVSHRRRSTTNRGVRGDHEHATGEAISSGLDVEEAGVGGFDSNSGSGGIKEVAPEIKVAKYKQSVWERDADLVKLRHMVYSKIDKQPENFYRIMWDTGMEAYLDGDFPTAYHQFTEVLRLSDNKDGPAKFLIGFITSCNGVRPDDWNGYRFEAG